MKRNEWSEIKKMDIKELVSDVKKVKQELSNLILDKNSSKLTDLKQVSKKRKDLAKLLTIVNQKKLLEQLGGQNG